MFNKLNVTLCYIATQYADSVKVTMLIQNNEWHRFVRKALHFEFETPSLALDYIVSTNE